MARKQKWSIVHDPEMRSAKKRKAGGQDRLQQIHLVREAWLYNWPDRPPTLAEDAAECELEEEPFGYLDSCQLRSLLTSYLEERACNKRSYIVSLFPVHDCEESAFG